MTRTFGLTLLVAIAATASCKKDTPPANDPNSFQQGNGQYGYPPGQPGAYGSYPQQGQPGAYPQQPGQQPTGAYPPATGAAPPATGQPTAAPASTAPAPTQGCDAGLAASLQPLLTPLAQQHAPGAKPEGGPVCGMLQEGQSAQVTVMLAAGGQRCYTGIGAGSPSVSQLDLALVAAPPPPLPPTTLSQSSGAGSMPIMAGKPNCFKNLLPVPVQAVFKVTATKGSGPALAQLYAK